MTCSAPHKVAAAFRAPLSQPQKILRPRSPGIAQTVPARLSVRGLRLEIHYNKHTNPDRLAP